MRSSKRHVEEDHNEDLTTGEHGSHPVGTSGGTAAAGAAGAGPVGVVASAVIGDVAGSLGGTAIAEKIDPTDR